MSTDTALPELTPTTALSVALTGQGWDGRVVGAPGVPARSLVAGSFVSPLLGGTQDFIGRLHLLEFLRRLRIIGADIGMVRLGEPAPRRTDQVELGIRLQP